MALSYTRDLGFLARLFEKVTPDHSRRFYQSRSGRSTLRIPRNKTLETLDWIRSAIHLFSARETLASAKPDISDSELKNFPTQATPMTRGSASVADGPFSRGAAAQS